jgi:serine/threonine protein kinase
MHRDLKSENIFLADSGGVKIGDFGLAYFTSNLHKSAFASCQMLIARGRSTTGVDGTWQYMAPEVCSLSFQRLTLGR